MGSLIFSAIEKASKKDFLENNTFWVNVSWLNMFFQGNFFIASNEIFVYKELAMIEIMFNKNVLK
ncbi:hypothetical protein D1631_15910 [Chryseobacterium nematophagum]|uniref:Uncharacterized protein n=1 Tax=Chryseobacterium nematophagum TaxID=2305228 RepID=A0A3M7TJM2_9FLAO|nr:hypothetical protein D1631_15910 [Chryseobacterium nematophagum]